MGTGTSRGRRETSRMKNCMDCRQGVPQGDHKEASKPRGPLPSGEFSLVPIKKKRDRFATAVSYNHASTTGTKPSVQARINFLHATQITLLINIQDSIYICVYIYIDS